MRSQSVRFTQEEYLFRCVQDQYLVRFRKKHCGLGSYHCTTVTSCTFLAYMTYLTYLTAYHSAFREDTNSRLLNKSPVLVKSSQFLSLHRLVTLLLLTSFSTASITTIAARGGRLTTNVNMGCNDILDFSTYNILFWVFFEEDRLLFQTGVFAQPLWKQNRTSSLTNMELFYKIKLVDRCNNWHIKRKYMKKVT